MTTEQHYPKIAALERVEVAGHRAFALSWFSTIVRTMGSAANDVPRGRASVLGGPSPSACGLPSERQASACKFCEERGGWIGG